MSLQLFITYAAVILIAAQGALAEEKLVQKPKPGVCPKPPQIFCKRAIFKCRQDGDCSGDKKCCRIPCGTECSSPVKTAELKSSDKTDCKMVLCYVDPCQFAKCSVPGAVCVPNYCGGCFAHFFNEKGHRVCNGGAS